MLGFLFFVLCFCAWLGKGLANKERYYDDYRAMGLDKYGCWQDGHRGWHYGNKELAKFHIGGHEVLAVPELLSYKNYSYTRWKYVVRDLTLEDQILRENDEIVSFCNDMKLRRKAIEEGKEFYEVSKDYRFNATTKGTIYRGEHSFDETWCLTYQYRRVDNNRMYFILDLSYNHGMERVWKYEINYIKNDYLQMKRRSTLSNIYYRTLVLTESKIMKCHRIDIIHHWGYVERD